MTDGGDAGVGPAPALAAYDPYAEWSAPTAYGPPAGPDGPATQEPAAPALDAVRAPAAPTAQPAFVLPASAAVTAAAPLSTHAAPAFVAPSTRPASLGSDTLATLAQRGRALTIDTLLVLIPTAVILAFLLPSVIAHAHSDPRLTAELSRANLSAGHPQTSRITHWVIALSIRSTLAWWVSLAAYSGYFMSRTGGQTPGRAATGIRIVRRNQQPIDATWAVYRVVLVRGVAFGLASLLTLGLATLARWCWSLWDDERRTLDDVLTRSRVVVDSSAASR